MMEELTLKQTQKIVDEWISQFEEGHWPPLSMLASLMEEVGELAREINHREKIKKKKETEPKRDIGLEIADVLFSLICLANHYGVDLESKFKEVVKKYSNRDMQRWTRKTVLKPLISEVMIAEKEFIENIERLYSKFREKIQSIANMGKIKDIAKKYNVTPMRLIEASLYALGKGW